MENPVERLDLAEVYLGERCWVSSPA